MLTDNWFAADFASVGPLAYYASIIAAARVTSVLSDIYANLFSSGPRTPIHEARVMPFPSIEPCEANEQKSELGAAGKQTGEQKMPHGHHHHHPHEWEDLPEELEHMREEIEDVLARSLGDAKKARRICRLALDDGPWHRYVTNIAFAGAILELLRAADRPDPEQHEHIGKVEEVELHLPPHLAGRRGRSYARLDLPARLLSKAFKSREAYSYAVDAMSEGPHNELASNVLLMTLIELLLARNPDEAEDAAGGNDAAE